MFLIRTCRSPLVAPSTTLSGHFFECLELLYQSHEMLSCQTIRNHSCVFSFNSVSIHICFVDNKNIPIIGRDCRYLCGKAMEMISLADKKIQKYIICYKVLI